MAEIYLDVDTALSEVPVNIFPLTDDTDFKTRETAVAYNASGMDLVWNFVTTAGAFTQTAVTPTTGGSYDWTHQGDGMYTIEIPASGGASINNDTEGFGWFTGVATGVMPWRSPIYGFRAAGINDKLIDSAYDTARGLAGTALPAAAADAAGGLPISDAGGLDLDTLLATLTNGTYGLSAIETLVDELESRLTAQRAANLDELGSANIPADIDTLSSRLTALRAGYIDNLSGGAVALASGVTVSDKTGFSLSSAGVTAVQTGLSTLTAQQVWEYATRTLSSFGSLVSDITTAVWGATTRTLSAFGFSVTASSVSDKTGYSLSTTPPTALEIADAVLDEALAGHTIAGTTGTALSAASSAGDPWNTLLPGTYAEGTAGYIIGNMVANIWSYAARTLTGFGTLVADIWNYITRTITGAAAGTTIPGYPTVMAGNITLGDIYNNAAAIVYGDVVAAPPPVHEIASMQSMILMRHRDCQLGFNYWFQQVQTTVDIITGTTVYQYPANFKEFINLEIDFGYEQSINGFTLTDTPTEDATAILTYWAILPAPGVWNAAYTDSITNYLTWYVTYAAVGDMYLKRSEKTEAQAYYQLADVARLNAEREDFHRRQSQGVIF